MIVELMFDAIRRMINELGLSVLIVE